MWSKPPRRYCELCFLTLSYASFVFDRALKIGGVEVAREKWDEVDAQTDLDEDVVMSPQTPHKTPSILPDWTRSPLPTGAAPARAPVPMAPPTLNVIVSPPHRVMTAVNG